MTALETDVADAKRKSSSSGDETKARIVQATLETLAAEGIAGTSARAIARVGDFNQALIFYHFGSVDDVIVAAVAVMNARRIEAHRAKLDAANSLTELIHVARALHDDDAAADNMTILTQAFAGATNHPEMGVKLYQQFEPWSKLVAEAIDRVLSSLPGAGTVPTDQIAAAISAMFIGIELLDSLDASQDHAAQLFDSLGSLAELLEDLLATPLLEMLMPDRSQ